MNADSDEALSRAFICDENKKILYSPEQLKRQFDLFVGITCLLLFLPLIVSIALIVLLAQGRPVMIRHPRIGRNGAEFGCYKFRTMVVDSDDVLTRHLEADPMARMEWNASRKLRSDPRVTPLGRFLRKTSLDEFPQIFNVIRGEMSFVGPRPIMRDEVVRYGSAINHYCKVRPGLTGSWQVSGRSDTSYERRVEIDAHYVANRSFACDLKILAQTIPAVLSSRGAF